jgi:hypothetical protein
LGNADGVRPDTASQPDALAVDSKKEEEEVMKKVDDVFEKLELAFLMELGISNAMDDAL